MGKRLDLTGKKFGRLTVLGFAGNNKHRQATWLCKCDCGNTTTSVGGGLTGGRIKSCGCSRRLDLIGKRFGRLTVKDFSERKDGRTFWLCECDCGNEITARVDSLTSGETQSCGCLRRTDIFGKRFSGLIVRDFVGTTKSGQAIWLCECNCGNLTTVISGNLISGNTRSCGCLQKKTVSLVSTTHGMSGHPLYKTWISMVQRCYNKNSSVYKYYGKRGIGICKRWRDIKNFIEDMGVRPNGLTLERINNDGGYYPENCKWATMTEQANNRRPKGSVEE